MMVGERGEDDEADEGGGNKVRNCSKNPWAKALALYALKISDGFIGSQILECDDIYADIKDKNPETGVSKLMRLHAKWR